jgi:hypothetical protein
MNGDPGELEVGIKMTVETRGVRVVRVRVGVRVGVRVRVRVGVGVGVGVRGRDRLALSRTGVVSTPVGSVPLTSGTSPSVAKSTRTCAHRRLHSLRLQPLS